MTNLAKRLMPRARDRATEVGFGLDLLGWRLMRAGDRVQQWAWGGTEARRVSWLTRIGVWSTMDAHRLDKPFLDYIGQEVGALARHLRNGWEDAPEQQTTPMAEAWHQFEEDEPLCEHCGGSDPFFRDAGGCQVCERCKDEDDDDEIEDARIAAACVDVTTLDLLYEIGRRVEEAENNLPDVDRSQLRALENMLYAVECALPFQIGEQRGVLNDSVQ